MEIPFNPEKAEIDRLFHEEDFDAIGDLPGIRIHERRNPRADFDSFMSGDRYFFGPDFWEGYGPAKGLEGYEEVGVPRKGDVAIYIEMGTGQNVGILVGDDIVRSKWGFGHVFDHCFELVPSIYGSEIRFFRKLDESRSGQMADGGFL